MTEERKIKLLRALLIAGGVLYVLGALLMTGLLGIKGGGGMRYIQYVPFMFVKDFIEGASYMEIMLWNTLCNVALFVPLGILLPALFPKTGFGRTVLWGFLGSLAIELAQYLLGAGISDVDDLILNTLGALVGAALYFGLFRRGGRESRTLALSIVFLALFAAGIVAALFLR